MPSPDQIRVVIAIGSLEGDWKPERCLYYEAQSMRGELDQVFTSTAYAQVDKYRSR